MLVVVLYYVRTAIVFKLLFKNRFSGELVWVKGSVFGDWEEWSSIGDWDMVELMIRNRCLGSVIW